MKAEIHRHTHRAMATAFELRLVHPDPDYARSAARAAFDRIDELEGLLSRFRDSSDLSRVNRARPGTPVLISPDLLDCLRASLVLHEQSGGLFDPGYRLPGTFREIEFDTGRPRVRFPRKVDLDLGGIGKGCALDQAAQALADWDIPSALLNAGGSTLLATAPPPGEDGWPVRLDAGRVIPLVHGSISASGTSVRGAHIWNPQTGTPSAETRRVWVEAETATESDAFSTACFLINESRTLKLKPQWKPPSCIRIHKTRS